MYTAHTYEYVCAVYFKEKLIKSSNKRKQMKITGE